MKTKDIIIGAVVLFVLYLFLRSSPTFNPLASTNGTGGLLGSITRGIQGTTGLLNSLFGGKASTSAGSNAGIVGSSVNDNPTYGDDDGSGDVPL